jgi:hypothetical protein
VIERAFEGALFNTLQEVRQFFFGSHGGGGLSSGAIMASLKRFETQVLC